MERGCQESHVDPQSRDIPSPQLPHREKADGLNIPTHPSSFPLIFSRGFLLAKSNRKWEGEEAHWCSSH